jgi:hypothetical protein
MLDFVQFLLCLFGLCILLLGVLLRWVARYFCPVKWISTYREILKRDGWAGLIRQAGWPVAIGLFSFFLLKGLAWLALAYGGLEMLR